MTDLDELELISELKAAREAIAARDAISAAFLEVQPFEDVTENRSKELFEKNTIKYIRKLEREVETMREIVEIAKDEALYYNEGYCDREEASRMSAAYNAMQEALKRYDETCK